MESTNKTTTTKPAEPVKAKVWNMTDVIFQIVCTDGGRDTFENCVSACLAKAKQVGLTKTAKGVEVSEANMKRQIKTLEADMENEVDGWRGQYQLVETKNGKPWYGFKLRTGGKARQ